VQTCTKCNQISPDTETNCTNCGVDLSEYSEYAVSLKKLQNNPRVLSIRISVAKNACPTCRAIEGVYAKESAPKLPIEGCSQPKGCDCFYAPILDEIFP
jgi:RNA polymerase subunit RPABC4/transcription elongation factor Spt4